jgi:cyclopropane fatty-acyl-phospholipid synthase-like methyltransferase
MDKTWFATWFDSEYYHKLYNKRNDDEAAQFIGKLMQTLQLPQASTVLDLACGKGRHSITLQKLGYDTTGVDLSPNSIAHAKQFETKGLQFAVHDMRQVLAVNYFDAVLNLFTSFGYLATARENAQVAKAMSAAAKSKGLIVIDFFNAQKLTNLYQEKYVGTEQRDQLQFSIEKHIANGRLIKDIVISEHGKTRGTFQESVQLLLLADFEKLFNGIATLQAVYGNYDLQSYTPQESERMIMVFQKNS